MESGAILDSQIKASSQYNALTHAAKQARLHFKAGWHGGKWKAGCWSALHNDQNQWLQIDLRQARKVTGIATQGRDAVWQWVKKYKLQYGHDGQCFTFYRRNGDNFDMV